jgi:hypothetical protein
MRRAYSSLEGVTYTPGVSSSENPIDKRVPPWINVVIDNKLYILSQAAMISLLPRGNEILSRENIRWREKDTIALLPELAYAVRKNNGGGDFVSKKYAFFITKEGRLIYEIRRLG